jgi:hypothetical protein
MIRHIVFFSAKPGETAQSIQAGLSVLTGITHARHIEIALNEKVDQVANEIDVVVYAEFDSLDALKAFKADPLYDVSTRTVRPKRELRFAVDIDTEKAARTRL